MSSPIPSADAGVEAPPVDASAPHAERELPLVSREESRRRTRRIALFMVPLFFDVAARLTGTALAPSLLVDHPLWLIALDPVYRHVVLVANHTPKALLFTLAVARLFSADPIYYLLGRKYGDDAVRWIERRSGGAGRIVRFIERLFKSAGVLILLVNPAGLVCVLAGASGYSWRKFLLINITGTCGAIALCMIFGHRLAGVVNDVRGFIQAHVGTLTAISIGLVVLTTLIRQYRANRAQR